MAKVDLYEFFMDFFNVSKEFVPESDHVEMLTNMIRDLEDQGYAMQDLYGIDVIVDEALLEVYPGLSQDQDNDEIIEE